MSLAENLSEEVRSGPFGIPLRASCIVCGEAFVQPKSGRPRILCRKRRCAQTRHNELDRNRPRPIRHTDADRAEAVTAWHGHCAVCSIPLAKGEDDKPLAHFVSDIVPVHFGCAQKELPARTWGWLARVAAGCPLPKPFVGGAG